MTTCILGAGWGSSATARSVTPGMGDTLSSRIVDTPKSWPVHNIKVLDDEINSAPDYAKLSGFSYPQRRIDISTEWAEFLNPTIVEYGGNSTVIDMILRGSSKPLGEVRIAHVLTATLATGLARSCIELDWQGTVLYSLQTSTMMTC